MPFGSPTETETEKEKKVISALTQMLEALPEGDPFPKSHQLNKNGVRTADHIFSIPAEDAAQNALMSTLQRLGFREGAVDRVGVDWGTVPSTPRTRDLLAQVSERLERVAFAAMKEADKEAKLVESPGSGYQQGEWDKIKEAAYQAALQAIS